MSTDLPARDDRSGHPRERGRNGDAVVDDMVSKPRSGGNSAAVSSFTFKHCLEAV